MRASLYRMRGKGFLHPLEVASSRARGPRAPLCVLEHALHDVREEVLREVHVAVESMKATSGSTIQNSFRWRRVLDFSARNVGPKQ